MCIILFGVEREKYFPDAWLQVGRFVGVVQVAISTYDMGTGVIRWAILFQVRKDRLEVVNELDGFNVAADDPIFH